MKEKITPFKVAIIVTIFCGVIVLRILLNCTKILDNTGLIFAIVAKLMIGKNPSHQVVRAMMYNMALPIFIVNTCVIQGRVKIHLVLPRITLSSRYTNATVRKLDDAIFAQLFFITHFQNYFWVSQLQN